MSSRTIIIRLDHLGDLVLTTPLIRAFAKAGDRVDVLTTRYGLPILDRSPHVQAAFCIEEVCPGFPRNWWRLGRWLRGNRYERLILPYARPYELLLASLVSGVSHRVAMWAGIAGRLTLHRCLRSGLVEHPRHISDIWLDCARCLGIAPAGLEPEIFPSHEELSTIRALLHGRLGDRTIIALHPGCGGNTCNLPTIEYARLAGLILDHTTASVVITGSGAERESLAHWPPAVLHSPRCWLAAGELDLRQLIALIAMVDLLVCVGTGPLHIASALRTRTLSPFCPYVGVSPLVWGNLGSPGEVLVAKPDRCPKLTAGGQVHCDFRGEITAETIFAQISSSTTKAL